MDGKQVVLIARNNVVTVNPNWPGSKSPEAQKWTAEEELAENRRRMKEIMDKLAKQEREEQHG